MKVTVLNLRQTYSKDFRQELTTSYTVIQDSNLVEGTLLTFETIIIDAIMHQTWKSYTMRVCHR